MTTNYPTSLDAASTVGGGTKPESTTPLDESGEGHPVHSAMHQNVGDALLAIETKLGTGSSTPAANKVLLSTGSGSEWGTVTGSMMTDNTVGQTQIGTNAVGADELRDDAVNANHLQGSTLKSTVTASSLQSVGTLSSLTVSGDINANGVVKITDGSEASPSLTFTSDTGNGMYLSGTDELSFATGGTQRLKITATGLVNFTGTSALSGNLSLTTSTTGFHYVMQNDFYGTFWKFASVRDTKEQITNVTAEDSGRWIDALQPVTYVSRWLGEGDEPADAREFRLADMQVGFIADDVLANSNTDHFAQVSDNGQGGLDPEGWKWECVIAAAVAEIKSLRARVTALEG